MCYKGDNLSGIFFFKNVLHIIVIKIIVFSEAL